MNNLKPAAPYILRRQKIEVLITALEGLSKSLRLFAEGLDVSTKSIRAAMEALSPEEEQELVTLYADDQEVETWPFVGDGDPDLSEDSRTSSDEQCCADGCCGPGSWCCARANPHEHDPDTGDLIDKARADKQEQDMLADEERD